MGTTSGSMMRYSVLYCGWLDTSWTLQLASQRVSRPELVGCPFADTDIQRLPRPDDVGERLHRLLQRRRDVVAVCLVQVDVVGPQPPSEALIDSWMCLRDRPVSFGPLLPVGK